MEIDSIKIKDRQFMQCKKSLVFPLLNEVKKNWKVFSFYIIIIFIKEKKVEGKIMTISVLLEQI